MKKTNNNNPKAKKIGKAKRCWQKVNNELIDFVELEPAVSANLADDIPCCSTYRHFDQR